MTGAAPQTPENWNLLGSTALEKVNPGSWHHWNHFDEKLIISSFVTSDGIKTVSFFYSEIIYKIVCTLSEDIICFIFYANSQISIFVISISLSFFCLCLAHRFDITLIICFRTIIIALNLYFRIIIHVLTAISLCWMHTKVLIRFIAIGDF